MSERKSEYIAGPEPEWSDEEERVAGILHDATCGCDLLMNRPLCLQKRYLLAARSILSTHRLTPIDPEGERLERERDEAVEAELARRTCPVCRTAIGRDRPYRYEDGLAVHRICIPSEQW